MFTVTTPLFIAARRMRFHEKLNRHIAKRTMRRRRRRLAGILKIPVTGKSLKNKNVGVIHWTEELEKYRPGACL